MGRPCSAVTRRRRPNRRSPWRRPCCRPARRPRSAQRGRHRRFLRGPAARRSVPSVAGIRRRVRQCRALHSRGGRGAAARPAAPALRPWCRSRTVRFRPPRSSRSLHRHGRRRVGLRPSVAVDLLAGRRIRRGRLLRIRRFGAVRRIGIIARARRRALGPRLAGARRGPAGRGRLRPVARRGRSVGRRFEQGRERARRRLVVGGRRAIAAGKAVA